MDVQAIRRHCLSLPHTTEHVQWGNDLVFKIAGKMFAVAALDPTGHLVSFKCGDQEYLELIEEPGFVPAPYLARAKWVAVERDANITFARLQTLLTKAHSIVLASLPRKARAALDAGA